MEEDLEACRKFEERVKSRIKFEIPKIPPGIIQQRAKIKHLDIQAKVIRANGTVEDYGVVAGWDKNPIKHLFLQLKILVMRLKIKYGIGISKYW